MNHEFDWLDWLLLPFAPIIIWWQLNSAPTPPNPPEHYNRLQ